MIIERNQYEQRQRVTPSNVSELVQHDIFRLLITLRDTQPIETFVLSYIIGHVQTIHCVQILCESAAIFIKFLQLWRRYTTKQLSPVIVQEINVRGNFGDWVWDSNVTLWFNRTFLQQQQLQLQLQQQEQEQEQQDTAITMPSLKTLVLQGFVRSLEISSLDLTNLLSLQLPVKYDRTMYSLAHALHRDCHLRTLSLDELDLAHQIPDVVDYFSIRLATLRVLDCLQLQVERSNSRHLQRIADAVPSSVRDLRITWRIDTDRNNFQVHACDAAGRQDENDQQMCYLGLMYYMVHAPCMVNLRALTLKLFVPPAMFNSNQFFNQLVICLQPCRNLQYLDIGEVPARGYSREPVHPLWELLSTWTTLKHFKLYSSLMIIDEACCEAIYRMLQRNTNMVQLEVKFRAPKGFFSTCQHYLHLNLFHFSDTLMVQDNIPLALWPHVLAKASSGRWLSVMFELLRQKSDTLLP